VLQDLSDEPLPNLKGANANLGIFNFYANKLEDYIHTGINPGQDLATDVLNTTEGQLWGGPGHRNRGAACRPLHRRAPEGRATRTRCRRRRATPPGRSGQSE
jgi:hypothetical protein